MLALWGHRPKALSGTQRLFLLRHPSRWPEPCPAAPTAPVTLKLDTTPGQGLPMASPGHPLPWPHPAVSQVPSHHARHRLVQPEGEPGAPSGAGEPQRGAGTGPRRALGSQVPHAEDTPRRLPSPWPPGAAWGTGGEGPGQLTAGPLLRRRVCPWGRDRACPGAARQGRPGFLP